MRIGVLSLAGLLAMPLTAAAGGACDSESGRASVGAGIAAAGLDVKISPSVAPYRVGEQVVALGGPVLTFNGEISLPDRWGVRAEASVAALHVERQIDGPVAVRPKSSQRVGRVFQRELLVGVRRTSRYGQHVCGYGALLAGAYRHAYGGVTSRAPGGAGVLGIGGAAGQTRPYVEVRVDFAENNSRPPLAAYLMTQVSITAGFRRRW